MCYSLHYTCTNKLMFQRCFIIYLKHGFKKNLERTKRTSSSVMPGVRETLFPIDSGLEAD